MPNPKSVALRELRPNFSVAARIQATLARLGVRRRLLSSTGQPLVRLDARQLALLEMSFDAMFLVNEQGKVSRTNAVAGEMFGESPQGLDGLSAAAFFRKATASNPDAPESDVAPEKFDPANYRLPTRLMALGLDYRSFPVELRSSEIVFDGARHHLLCIRELAVE